MTTTMRPADERRWTWGAWLTLAVVAVLLLAAAGCAYAALCEPTDGWLTRQDSQFPPPISTFVGDWSTPLRPGDQVSVISGVATLSDFTQLDEPVARPAGWHVGGSVPYTIKHDGQTLTVDVPIRQLDNAGVLQAFAAAAADQPPEWGYLVIGALIFALRPGNVAARLLFLFGGAHAAISKISWATPWMVRYNSLPVFWTYEVVNGAWGYAVLPALLLLVLSFPRPTWLVRRFPRLTPALLFGASLLGSLLSVFTASGVLVVLVVVGLSVAFLIAVATVPALTLWRSRDPVERAQVSWMLLGVGLSIGLTLLIYQLGIWVPGFAVGLNRIVPPWIGSLAALAMPICLGIAITRYRLFDITIIIRRTLVYTLLTLALGAVYLGSVVGLQALFVQLTGQESTLAVVASTLVIAALFGPLRRRVQGFIDRRFFRRKYDARKVLEAFALRAQQQADLDALSTDILQVVQETLEPEGTRLWLVQTRQSSTTSPAKSA